MAKKRNRRHRSTPKSVLKKENAAVPTPTSLKPPALPEIFANSQYGYALSALAICLLVAVSYFPATMAGLVWDDIILEKAKPIHHWMGLWDIWFVPRSLIKFEGHYWPLLYTTFWLEHKLWGTNPLGFHIVNLILHAAMSLLLWRVLIRFSVPWAWLVAAVFAVHPLHVESVAWVFGRKDVLAALFYVGAVWGYMCFVETGRRANYALALGMLVASLLSKSTAVTLPVTLLLWHWWKSGRVTMNDVARIVPFALIGSGIIIADLLYSKSVDVTAFDYSWVERLLIVARAVWFYVGKLLWPTALAVIYQRWEVSASDWFAWGIWFAGLALVVALWHYRAQIGRGALVSVLFFVVTLSPTLGLVDHSYMKFSFVADRYQYLAGIGVMVLVLSAVWRLVNWWEIRGWVVSLGALLLLSVLGALTWQQSGIYRDQETFFKHIISINPQARSAHYNLGNMLRTQNRLDEALAMYQLSLKKRPTYIKLHNNIGLTLMQLERLEEAEKHIQYTLELQPNFVSGLINLGALRSQQKRHQESIELYQKALNLDPQASAASVGLEIGRKNLRRATQADEAQPAQ